MPINRKRRIFRPAGTPSSGAFRRVCLFLLAGALIVTGGAWFGLQPSEAPASSAPPGHFSADPTQIRVVDANTLILGNRAVQLAGVRATERGAICVATGGTRFDCGAAAANALAAIVRGSAIDCALNGSGQSGRPLAMCSAGGRDIALAMVAAGWARADVGMPGLGDAERVARVERRGLWAGSWISAE